ncbi:hypothetical protein [Burkholderia multivorans]|uniref:hypothetical protein n=1 Tax=Burkholderia multivorans TaxID=87883 RepID=UPI001C24C9CD|nr:hypothetical protein [Burkholderia multivorans]MBU9163578.1 hypothetical protein [Burkholderia multivorans]
MSGSNASSIRGLVKVNDEPIKGWIDFEVESNTYASSDSFRVRFAANALPADRSVAWFSQQQNMYVELFAGVPADPTNWTTTELPSWIYGQVDNINHDPVSGVVEVSGRDLGRMLIDAKTTEKFQNKTSSQIAAILALRHGLTPQVTKTSTLVGKYYAIDHDAMNNARTEWDLLCYLARIEQFVVYVRGKTLYYQPRLDPTRTPPYRITWTPPDVHNGSPTCNVEGLRFSRTLTVSRGVYVQVRSFNDVDQRVYTATYPTSASKRSTAPGSVGNSSDAQTYFYSVPNLTQQQCVRMAQAKYQDIVRHEMRAEFEVPAAGNDDLNTTSIIEISGTGTAYDQLYYPESITRELSFQGGYRMTVHAKNHAPDSLAQG